VRAHILKVIRYLHIPDLRLGFEGLCRPTAWLPRFNYIATIFKIIRRTKKRPQKRPRCGSDMVQ